MNIEFLDKEGSILLTFYRQPRPNVNRNFEEESIQRRL